MSKIYDAFLFFNELDLLEIRLELLYNKVDYFIISECDTTFNGDSKPFYYDENKHLFEKYKDKIIHIKNVGTFNIDDIPLDVKNSPVVEYGAPHWCREWLQREHIKKGMINCDDDDTIIFGDLDEIPNPDKIEKYQIPTCLRQRNMIYFLNKENISETWLGCQIAPYSYFKDRTLNSIRGSRGSFSIIDGGWHLSYMGGVDRISLKIRSFSHQEYNNDVVMSRIDYNIHNNWDILNRGIRIINVDIKNVYPDIIVSLVRNKYEYLIYE